MQFSVRRNVSRVVVIACIAVAALVGSLSFMTATAQAASCDVIDASAYYINSYQYSYKGYAVGCGPYGTDYEWRVIVRTKQGNFVREHTGVRYNPGSSWQTSTWTYGGSGAYCVEFRVRNHATDGFLGSGTDCT